jgi:hypothetical protein
VAGGPALVSGTVDDAPPEVVGLVVGSVVVLVPRLVLVVGLVVGLVLVLMVAVVVGPVFRLALVVVVGLVFRFALVLVETLWAIEPAELRRCGVWTSRPIPAVSPPNTAPTRAARPAALAFWRKIRRSASAARCLDAVSWLLVAPDWAFTSRISRTRAARFA